MNTRLVLAAATALALAACTGEPTVLQTRAPAPPRASGEPTAVYTIFQTLGPAGNFTPADTTTEYGTRFKSSMPGRVVGLRLYTFSPGTHKVRLRTDGGAALDSVTITGAATPGWRFVLLGTPRRLGVNAYYRVSVATTLPVGMTTGFFTGGPFTSYMLTATHGFTYPAGQTMFDGTTAYFVDVEFQPDPV